MNLTIHIIYIWASLFSILGVFFLFLPFFLYLLFFLQKVQTLIRGLHQEPSDLGLHFLQMTPKRVSRAEWVNLLIFFMLITEYNVITYSSKAETVRLFTLKLI